MVNMNKEGKLLNRIVKSHFGLLLIIILSIMLRAYGLKERVIGIDEGSTVENVITPVIEMIQSLPAEDYCPPLYPLLAKIVYVLTTDLFFVKLLSVIPGVITILVLYFLIKKIGNKNTALISALILTITPLHIIYSQHMRVYALFMLLTLLSTYLFYNYCKGNERNSKKLLIVNIINIFAHYYAIAIVFMQWIYLIFKEKKITKRNSIPFIMPLILIIPWMIFFISKTTLYGDPGDTANAFTWLYLFYKYSAAANISLIVKNNIILLLLAPVCSLLFLKGMYELNNKSKEFFNIIVFTFIIPFALIFSIGLLIKPKLTFFRYFVQYLPIYISIVSIGISSFKSNLLKTALILIIVLSMFIIASWYYIAMFDKSIVWSNLFWV